ncbi:MAG TPA: TetR family transcriptional regulator, partial [Alphaproteobacteria bacterium]|nr:TetR family transcriptional regulator [Alphaproteobacteria bacterium]
MSGKDATDTKRPAVDRGASEAALEAAALRLLRRHGVLAGLNLREVADEAGVNRGLVYHYFGS